MIIPNIWKNKKCSKPPISIVLGYTLHVPFVSSKLACLICPQHRILHLHLGPGAMLRRLLAAAEDALLCTPQRHGSAPPTVKVTGGGYNPLICLGYHEIMGKP